MTFFRWHSFEAPPFTAVNAWSGLWGSEFSADGARTKCPTCDGSGDGWRECPSCHGDPDGCERCADAGVIDECEDCEGEGWRDCVRGYSSCASAEDLLAYMREHAGEPKDDWGKVVIFDGDVTGTGHDDEPCVVPTQIVKQMTWSEFKEDR